MRRVARRSRRRRRQRWRRDGGGGDGCLYRGVEISRECLEKKLEVDKNYLHSPQRGAGGGVTTSQAARDQALRYSCPHHACLCSVKHNVRDESLIHDFFKTGFSRTTQASKIDGACLRGRSSQPPHRPLLPREWQRRRPFVVLPPSSSSCLLGRGKARVAPAPLVLQQSSHHIKLCAAGRIFVTALKYSIFGRFSHVSSTQFTLFTFSHLAHLYVK